MSARSHAYAAVMISGLLEPHAFASMMQFCSRAFLCTHTSLHANSAQKHHLSASRASLLSPQSRIGTNPHALPQFGTKVNAASSLRRN